MSDGFASYGYLSWLRRGIATGLTTPDAATLGQPRISLPVQVSVSSATAGTTPVSVSGLFLSGPGEVTGFDSRAVARVWPQPNTSDAEPNYFPIIELVPADLPWQYTPAAPEASYGRLRPWFCMIALTDDEYSLSPQANGAPALNVNAAAPLPKLSQSWAWAHVQVAGESSLNGSSSGDVATIQDMLANQPQNLVARVLCPRRLKPRARYTVFVVPVFARGAQTGLQTPPADSVDALAQSWDDSDAPSRAAALQLPVYYSWSFLTGDFGDFEYLVRQLSGGPVPNTVGTRPMNVSAPGGGLAGASPGSANILGLEGALKAPNSGTTWSAPDRQSWTNALVGLTQAAPPLQTALPLYGRWHEGRTGLTASLNYGLPLPWFDDLNTDPRLRVAAALGVAVVQAEQQQLMASAWKQGAGILELNTELRQAQLGRESTNRIYKRQLLSLKAETALQVTGPLHSRISYSATDCVTNLGTSRPVSAWLAVSPAPRGFFDPQWRRITRACGGPLARTGVNPSNVNTSNLLSRVMNGSFAPAAQTLTPIAMSTMAAAGIDATRLTAALTSPPNGPSTASPVDYYPVGEKKAVTPNPSATSDNAGTNWSLFGRAAKDLAAALSIQPATATKTCPIDPATLNNAVMTALNPNTTMSAAYAGRLQLTSGSAWQSADPLSPVYIAPQFPQPAFEPLRKISQDWVLPGLDQVPPNTITLLESNGRFVEAYMAGLNFELGRELIWNGIPTDQRGTYFRRFWDHSVSLTASGQIPDPDSLDDIDVMTHWTHPLGQNPNPSGLPAGELYLLVRGDLFRRYPNALLYATKAIIGSNGKRAFPDPNATPPPQEQYPLFSIVLKPDVSCFAFDLSYTDAYGDPSDPNNASNPGWYFVLQEHAAETRFGLEAESAATFNHPLADWEHMSWGNLASDATALQQIAYIDLDATLPDTSQAQNPGDPATTGLLWHAGQGSRAADIAYVALRDPFRVAIHASALLPKGGS